MDGKITWRDILGEGSKISFPHLSQRLAFLSTAGELIVQYYFKQLNITYHLILSSRFCSDGSRPIHRARIPSPPRPTHAWMHSIGQPSSLVCPTMRPCSSSSASAFLQWPGSSRWRRPTSQPCTSATPWGQSMGETSTTGGETRRRNQNTPRCKPFVSPGFHVR